jgi:hypothetical protein
VPPSRNLRPSRIPLAGQHNVGSTGPVSTTRHTHLPVNNSTTHPKLIHRFTWTSETHATTHRDSTITTTQWQEYKRPKRGPHNLYTVRLHIQFRAPDDGQWSHETCRAIINNKNIVNLSQLVGHIYHLISHDARSHEHKILYLP